MQDNAVNTTPDQQQADRIREAEAKVAAMFANAKSQNKRPVKKRSSRNEDTAPVLPFVPPVKQESKVPADTPPREETIPAKTETAVSETAADIPSDTVADSAEAVSETDKVSEAEARVAAMFASAKSQSKAPSKLSRDIFADKKKASADPDETSQKLSDAEDKLDALFANAAAQDSTAKKGGNFGMLVTEVLILEFIGIFILFMALNSSVPGFSIIGVLMPATVGILYRMYAKQLTLMEAISKCKLHIFISIFIFVCAMLSV